MQTWTPGAHPLRACALAILTWVCLCPLLAMIPAQLAANPLPTLPAVTVRVPNPGMTLEAARTRSRAIQKNLTRYRDYPALNRETAALIHDVAVETHLDVDLAFGLVRTESEFIPTATSPVGAIGLAQLMLTTARSIQPGLTRAAIREPRTNLKLGFMHLHWLLERYHGDRRLALLAYNRGYGTVDRILNRGGDPSNGYARRVTARISD